MSFVSAHPGNAVRLGALAVVSVALLATAGCALLTPEDASWPDDLPPLAYFRDAYAADPVNRAVQSEADYLSWIYRFYKGWIAYAVGWLDIRAGVVASVPPAEAERVGARLDAIGRSIAAEWAKASRTRYVYKQTLAAWGEALAEAVNRGEVDALIDRVEADLKALAARTLSPDVITTDRYYPGLDDGDPFGD